MLASFDPSNPEHMQMLLVQMAAASIGAHDSRERLARNLRAALVLIEGEAPSWTARKVDPAVAKALEGLATGLGNMAEHAELLAERAGELTRTPPRPTS